MIKPALAAGHAKSQKAHHTCCFRDKHKRASFDVDNLAVGFWNLSSHHPRRRYAIRSHMSKFVRPHPYCDLASNDDSKMQEDMISTIHPSWRRAEVNKNPDIVMELLPCQQHLEWNSKLRRSPLHMFLTCWLPTTRHGSQQWSILVGHYEPISESIHVCQYFAYMAWYADCERF